MFSPDEHMFASFRATLDAVLKKGMAEGMGDVKHTKKLTVDEENDQWENGFLNKFTPNVLSYRVFCFRFGGLYE